MEDVQGFVDSLNHQHCETNGVRLHYVDERPKGPERATIVLCHGFPDFWFGWRHQILLLRDSGFRVIAPDFRGYGKSQSTTDASSYRWKNICLDISGLMDHAKVQKAIFLGHDWGGWFVWRMCLWFPERVLAVGAIVTSYLPPSKFYLSSAKIAEKLPMWKYQQYFDEGGDEAVRELEGNVERTIAAIVRMPSDRPGISSFWMKDGTLLGRGNRIDLPRSAALTQAEYDFYVQTFKESGFAGCINYYRTRLMNFEDEKVFTESQERLIIRHEALIITASKDVILSPKLSIGMENVVPNLTRHSVDAGHWAHVEKKEEVNQILINWLQKVVASSKL